eukprot:365231-Chlamydomonas_euryale.AAC.1
MESVLEAMGSLAAGPAAKPGGAAAGRRNGGGGGGGAPALIAVAEETDFELQITELSEENARLMATLQQMQVGSVSLVCGKQGRGKRAEGSAFG